jgi:proline iminopeptidase
VHDYFAPQDSSFQSAGIKMIPIMTPAGNFHVWTKTIGNNPRIKVLLLHGGPAFTHEYMECFESFFPREGFEMIEYDQLGSFYSDQPKDTSLWTIERFAEEVEQVRNELGLNKDNFYLLGNSWGSMLAMQYALKYKGNLKGLIITNMMSSIPDFNEYNKKILKEDLGQPSLDSMEQMEAAGQTESLHYNQFLQVYNDRHMCRVIPNPDPMLRGFTHMNRAVMNTLIGPGNINLCGRLANWDIKKRLPEIKVPTLVVGAKYDFMDPNLWDDQKDFYPGIIKFIRDVDEGRFRKDNG